MVASPLGEALFVRRQLPELEMVVMSFGVETGDDDWTTVKKPHETTRIDDGLFNKFTLFVLIL